MTTEQHTPDTTKRPTESTGTAAGEGLSALLVREDGTHEAITLPTDATARVAQLQRLVGGLFDCVDLDGHTDMWVNDVGVFTCERNPVASRLAAAHGFDLQSYYGPAVFTGGVDGYGDTLGLRPQDLDLLAGMAAAANARGELWDDVPDGHRFDEVHRRSDPEEQDPGQASTTGGLDLV